MKKAILTVLSLLAAAAVPFAQAETAPVNLLITGGKEDNSLQISLSPDGRDYVILSEVPLEAGGELCSHPEENPNELRCKATAIAGFEVNAGAGDDTVTLSPNVPVPATLRGGPGRDRLTGGGASDKIIGGSDHDVLSGRRGNDWIYGGPGSDRLLGGPGDDQLRGGPGKDGLVGGPGRNTLVP